MDPGLGNCVDIILKWGHIQKGDYIITGTIGGKVKNMLNDSFKRIDVAYPGMAVRLQGLNCGGKPGDWLFVCKNENNMKEVFL